MRLLFRLPPVKPDAFQDPQFCPYPGCKGRHFQQVQEVPKPIRDTQYQEVKAYRYRCLRCGRTFRVYPSGVSRDRFPQRVKGLAVALYLLGLSYGAVSLLLEALDLSMSKTMVYYTVQEAARKVLGMRRQKVMEGVRVSVLGSDVASVKVKGKWYPIEVAVNAVSGWVIWLEGLAGKDAQSLKEWLQPVAEATGMEILVTDDADAFKQVADGLGLPHQVCKSHVRRNTEQLVEELRSLAKEDRDGSLRGIGVTPEQAVADLDRLKELVQERQPEQWKELETMLERYLGASPPR